MRKPCKLNVKQDFNLSKEPIRICTWNVRTMYKAEKINNELAEVVRLRIDIMGISEMRMSGNGQCIIDNHKVYHSGDENNKHVHGVGLIISRILQDYIINFTPVSERIIVIQLNGNPVNINIVQVYAPTTHAEDAEIDQFYNEISVLLKQFKKYDMTIIMGDFNAKISKGKCGVLVGEHGLGVKN